MFQEIEAIKARVKEMEEEAEKLKEMQSDVEKIAAKGARKLIKWAHFCGPAWMDVYDKGYIV